MNEDDNQFQDEAKTSENSLDQTPAMGDEELQGDMGGGPSTEGQSLEGAEDLDDLEDEDDEDVQ